MRLFCVFFFFFSTLLFEPQAGSFFPLGFDAPVHGFTYLLLLILAYALDSCFCFCASWTHCAFSMAGEGVRMEDAEGSITYLKVV